MTARLLHARVSPFLTNDAIHGILHEWRFLLQRVPPRHCNAETYMLVGEAMGKAIVELEKK